MLNPRPVPARTPRVSVRAVALALAVLATVGGLTDVLPPRPAPAPTPAAAGTGAGRLEDRAQTGPTGSDRPQHHLLAGSAPSRPAQLHRRHPARGQLDAEGAGDRGGRALRPGRGGPAGRRSGQPDLRSALAGLAGVYFAEHRFARALALAGELVAGTPGPTQASAIAADAKLELGGVAGAATGYRSLLARAPSPPVYSRMARLAFLQGQTAQAIAWATRSVTESAGTGVSGETLAWYRFQLGDLDATAGRLDAAEAAFAAALRDLPGYYLALAGLARVAARGDLARAEDLYAQAVEVVPRPDLLAALGDVQAARGDGAAARRQYATVAYIGTLAAVAWTAYQAGAHARADAAARHAIALGTRDPRLLYHAGMAALGSATAPGPGCC